MREVSFGQYYPIKSPLHRCDPRVKLLLSIGYMVLLFFIPTVTNYVSGGGSVKGYLLTAGVCYAIAMIFVIAAIIASRVPPLKVLRSVRGVLLVIVFMTAISTLFYSGKSAQILWSFSIFTVSVEGIVSACTMSLRIIFLVLGPSLLTLTTTPVELTDGLESLLTPLKWIKLPVHELAIIMSIALRLVPTLIEETDKIIAAQKARCADFDSGNLFKKAKALLPVLIPLFVSSFRRADELADAMDSRCYHGAKGRTRMKRMHLSYRDAICFLVFAAAFTAVLCLKYDFFNLATMILGAVGI